jgi:hypothetical protein
MPGARVQLEREEADVRPAVHDHVARRGPVEAVAQVRALEEDLVQEIVRDLPARA